MSARDRLWLHAALLALLLCTVPFVVWDISPVLRTVLGLAALLFVPGGAALTRTRVNGWPEWIGLAVAVGLAAQTAGTLTLLWTRWWHPAVLAAVVSMVSAALLSIDVWKRSQEVRAGAHAVRM